MEEPRRSQRANDRSQTIESQQQDQVAQEQGIVLYNKMQPRWDKLLCPIVLVKTLHLTDTWHSLEISTTPRPEE
jgi:hypothetical protein